MSPQRIQRRRTKGWRMPENTVYVGRGSRWGNPFSVNHGHTIIGPPWFDAKDNWGRVTAADATNASSRGVVPAEVVDQFRMLMQVRARDEPQRFARWIKPLRGKNLACWCPDGHSCHADVLLELANKEAS
ncbi:DUF4326 domain-containing protein [Sinomonas susongensis]|uniref:DUF4326 domain-containing protein n=1 Tax=Sinomonas susongensis TaxID=1324851 RepID=UPI001109C2AA|nr:DUF4326 domain-containing protein [Sinomonas susongensis]